MEFDLEYKLQEFRKEQHEIFDEDGKRYGATPISNNTGERMLQLIDELVCALEKAETEMRQLTIPDVVGQSKQLLAFFRWYCNYKNNIHEGSEEEIIKEWMEGE